MQGPVYLDHAATTPIRPAALARFVAVSSSTGNAASLHGPGRVARRVLEEARESLAASLRCEPDEVVFTSGGTEADNLAVVGLYRARRAADPRCRRLLVSAVEHPAVAAAALGLAEREGAEIVELPVDSTGRVDVLAAGAALWAGGGPDTVALLACMRANNEVGTIQPIDELFALLEPHDIPVHVDAVQSAGILAGDSGVAPATVAVSGHKVGGPVGCGALVVRRGITVAPMTHGGGQEAGLRPGTVAVAAVAAMATAFAEACGGRDTESTRLGDLWARLVRGVLAACPDARVSGPTDAALRLPSIAHITIPGCDSEALLVLLDREGIAASTGSACRSGVLEPSPVLRAMGLPEHLARGAVRFSLGHTTTAADIDRVGEGLARVVAGARAAAAASRGREAA